MKNGGGLIQFLVFVFMLGVSIMHAQTCMPFLGNWIMDWKNKSPLEIQHHYRSNDSIETSSPKKGIVCLHGNLLNVNKELSLQYKGGKLTHLLIENVEDTSGMHLFCVQINASKCRLFRGVEALDYSSTEPDKNYPAQRNYKRVKNWIVLVDLSHQKIEKPEIWVMDSTTYYQEVLKNQLFNYEFGWFCGEGGEPPLGRMAFNYLVMKKAFEPLLSLSNIENDEGLMYVVEFLMLTQPGFSVNPSIQLRNISTCEGCIGWEHTSLGKIMKQLKNPDADFGYGFLQDQQLLQQK